MRTILAQRSPIVIDTTSVDIAESINRAIGNAAGALVEVAGSVARKEAEAQDLQRIGIGNTARSLAMIEGERERGRAFDKAIEALDGDRNKLTLEAGFASARMMIEGKIRESERSDTSARGTHLGLVLEQETIDYVDEQVRTNRENGIPIWDLDFSEMIEPLVAKGREHPNWEPDEDYENAFGRQVARAAARHYGLREAELDLQERIQGVNQATDIFSAYINDPTALKTDRDDWGQQFLIFNAAMDAASFTGEQKREARNRVVATAIDTAIRNQDKGMLESLRAYANQHKGQMSLAQIERGIGLVDRATRNAQEPLAYAMLDDSQGHADLAEATTYGREVIRKGPDLERFLIKAEHRAVALFDADIYNETTPLTTGRLELIQAELDESTYSDKVKSAVSSELDKAQEIVFDAERVESLKREEAFYTEIEDSAADPGKMGVRLQEWRKAERKRMTVNRHHESVRLWPIVGQRQTTVVAEDGSTETRAEDATAGDAAFSLRLFTAVRDAKRKREGSLDGTKAYNSGDFSGIDWSRKADKEAKAAIHERIEEDAKLDGGSLAIAALATYKASNGHLPEETWALFLADIDSGDEARVGSAADFFAQAADMNRLGFERSVTKESAKGWIAAQLTMAHVDRKNVVASAVNTTEDEAKDALEIVAELDKDGLIGDSISEATDPGGFFLTIGGGILGALESGGAVLERLAIAPGLAGGREPFLDLNAITENLKRTAEYEVPNGKATDMYRAVYADTYAGRLRRELERGRDEVTARESAHRAATNVASAKIAEEYQTETIYGKRYLIRNEGDKKFQEGFREILNAQIEYLIAASESNRGFFNATADLFGALDNVTAMFDAEQEVDGIRVVPVIDHNQNDDILGWIVLPDVDDERLGEEINFVLSAKNRAYSKAVKELKIDDPTRNTIRSRRFWATFGGPRAEIVRPGQRLETFVAVPRTLAESLERQEQPTEFDETRRGKIWDLLRLRD